MWELYISTSRGRNGQEDKGNTAAKAQTLKGQAKKEPRQKSNTAGNARRRNGQVPREPRGQRQHRSKGTNAKMPSPERAEATPQVKTQVTAPIAETNTINI